MVRAMNNKLKDHAFYLNTDHLHAHGTFYLKAIYYHIFISVNIMTAPFTYLEYLIFFGLLVMK